MLLFGVVGLWVYACGYVGQWPRVDAKSLQRLAMHVLWPLMFFFGLMANDHVSEGVGLEVAYVYAVSNLALYGIAVLSCSRTKFFSRYAMMHAIQISSNHLFLVASPMAGALLGFDVLPIMVIGMCVQLMYVLVFALMCREQSAMFVRYSQDMMPIWMAVVLGLVASFLPWVDSVRAFSADSFDWLASTNVLFSALVMSTKSLEFGDVLRESLPNYLIKTAWTVMATVVFSVWMDFGEAEVLLLVMMLLAPGVMLKSVGDGASDPVGSYWSKAIAGSNVWYMLSVVFVLCLLQLMS